MAYKNQYAITAIIRATEGVKLDHKEKTLIYQEIDSIIENEAYQVHDTTNNRHVAEIEGGIDDESVYEAIHNAITAYESGEINEK